MKSTLRGWITRWWSGGGGPGARVLSTALWPAEFVFARASQARNAAYDAGLLRRRRAPIPVVSVGNLRVGGAGKTPVTAWIAERYAEWGLEPAVVMRGYGSDEVLVHREINPRVPVYVAPRRIAGVLEAAADGCGVAVLDDGFQHRELARDLDIVLIAAESWDARRRLLPRGPWRETTAALRRADLVLVTRKSASAEGAEKVAAEVSRLLGGAPVAACGLFPAGLTALSDSTVSHPLEWLRGREVLAVTSLADPAPFVRQLGQLGALVDLMDYPDHYAFESDDVDAIYETAGKRPIVMTRKEAVKLRPLMDDRILALLLEQRVVVESGGQELLSCLRAAVAR